MSKKVLRPPGTTEILPENILDLDTKSVKCFLCDEIFVTGDVSFMLFNKRINSDGSSECPLAQVLASALDINVDESTAHSPLLCSSCNDIVLEYENLEGKLLEIRLHIVAAYNKTASELKESDIVQENDFLEGRQDDDDENNVNENVDEIQENSNDLAEEIIDEELKMVSHAFESFEMIDGTEFLDAEDNASFDENKDTGIIICEETQSESAHNDSEDHNITEIENNGSDCGDIIHDNNNESNVFDESSVIQNEFYSCSMCDNSMFLDAKAFSQHMYSEHKLRVYPFDANQREEELNEQIERKTLYECESCNRSFDNYRLYRAHNRNMHNSAHHKFECQECCKRFNTKTSLDEHMNTHSGQRPFSCEQCSRKFASRYSLSLHLKTHGERERPYKCAECAKLFLTAQNLQHHMKIHDDKVYTCEICSKTFVTQHNLDAHRIVHSGKRPFSCRTCGKSFARRAEVIDHERIHTGDRPFKCDICEMAFAQRSNLTAHKKYTHFNEKLHECEICKRSFKRRRLLDYHIRAVHTGERPYKCETCGSSFVYPEHYKKHLRIHTGIKPFECEVCGKRFSSRDNRNTHRFVHSHKKPYECVECGAGFMRKPLLLAHMKYSKHVNDSIIVNQPQISEGQVKTATLTKHNGDECLEEELIIPHDDENEKNTINDDDDDGENVCEGISLEKILPSGAGSGQLDSTVHESSNIEIKSEEIDDLKFDALNWEYLAAGKD